MSWLIASLYAAACIALASFAITSDQIGQRFGLFLNKGSNSHSLQKQHNPQIFGVLNGQSKLQTQPTHKLDSELLENVLVYGVFTSGNIHPMRASTVLSADSNGNNVFEYSPESDYPDWVPEAFQNPWTFLAIAIAASLTVALIVLGRDRISSKWAGWVSWLETSEAVRHGVMYPQFPIHVLNGLLAVVGPVFLLRDLRLDVALLGALIFAEHAIQALSHSDNGALVAAYGPKAGQRRAVLLLFASAALLAALPLMPHVAWTASSPWIAFAIYAIARLLHAWGTAQFDAACGAALGNSAFLPPHHLLRALDLLYCAGMLGAFVGSLLALLAAAALDLRWALLLPAALVAVVFVAVEAIPQVTGPKAHSRTEPASLR